MKLDLFLQKTENIKAENRLLKFVVILIGLAVLINSFMIYNFAEVKKTILIPVGMQAEFSVVGSAVSDKYVKKITRYIFGLAFSYTPRTAEKQFSELLDFYSPNSFAIAKRKFHGIVESIQLVQVSQILHIGGIERQGNRVFVSGELKQFAGDREVIHDENVRYVMDFSIKNGRFFIESIKEIIDRQEVPLL